MRRATNDAINGCNPDFISIHALLAESDNTRGSKKMELNNFYPRSPCGERRFAGALRATKHKFLSTLSLRRATSSGNSCTQALPISIHALLAESDYDTSSLMQCQAKFLSTLSLRRATSKIPLHCCPITNFYPRSPCGERQSTSEILILNPLISIHALLAESDGQRHLLDKTHRRISIHALLAESDAS